jgi:hypothetical protein
MEEDHRRGELHLEILAERPPALTKDAARTLLQILLEADRKAQTLPVDCDTHGRET